ncbi:MAG: phosphoribosylformylglycinamidine cyclo-ligase, partial [Gammaproteobacteria bacterium]|nr:phosphoribosylformylglycinamidine cyclo-ligase [Gammaproteobacteria bacterium]
ERVINGIAHGCQLAGCALVGGETAEMPGFYGSGDYDLAGFCIGVVERGNIVHGQNISVGNKLIGLASSGPHSNGYSLIRHIVEAKGVELKSSLLDQLMAPTRIYAKSVLALQEQVTVLGMAHITGGGVIENLPRMFADDTIAALVDLDSWSWPEVFNWLQQAGNIAQSEMLRTFNCGIGFVLCVEEDSVAPALEILEANGEKATVIGEIVNPDAATQEGQLLIGVS